MNLKLKKTITYGTVIVLFNFINPSSKSAKNYEVDTLVSTMENDNDFVAVMAAAKNTTKNLIFDSDTSSAPDKYAFKYYIEGDMKNRPEFNFSGGGSYALLPGVTCFRGNNTRSGGSYGKADIKEKKFEKVWEKRIGGIDSWGGVGWNGQPAIVKWDKDTLNNMNLYSNKKAKADIIEVIYAALDGYVHFIDLEDGKDTRECLKVGAPIKGSVTVDPRGIPLLYVGQGIDKNGKEHVDFAYRIFSLINFKKLYEIKGNDGFAPRNWGAFDSTALIDRNNDSLLICGENGVFYSGKLNTKYGNGNIEIKPNLQKYKYNFSRASVKGIENSIAAYYNYGFFADNDGLLQCIELNTLKPVWLQNVNDDTDSTVVLEEDKNGLSLYTACEVDHQGSQGNCYMRKIDVLTGKILWENKYKCAYDSEVNGGALATPICGKESISDLVIFNVARTPGYNTGLLVAFDKITGKEIWKLKLNNYCWSSPVALYTSEGKCFIVQCDSIGKTMLIDGMSGMILDTIDLGSNVEGSPAAFNNILVIGTRGGKIIAFKVN